MSRGARWQRLQEQRERVARAVREGAADADAQAGPAADDASSGVQGPTMEQRAAIVETAIQQAMRRGDFDNLPGAGKPLTGLGSVHDPDWWIRRKIQTEQLSGLGPPALMLRVEHRELEGRLDGMFREAQVRAALDDFNRRIIEARRQLQGGPPVVTPTRDVEVEVRAWHARREARERETSAARESNGADRADAQGRGARRGARILRRWFGADRRAN